MEAPNDPSIGTPKKDPIENPEDALVHNRVGSSSRVLLVYQTINESQRRF